MSRGQLDDYHLMWAALATKGNISMNTTLIARRVAVEPLLLPEQVRGEDVGTAADIYALGLVLLECLTGRRNTLGRQQSERGYRRKGYVITMAKG